jgi:hypothetical protein
MKKLTIALLSALALVSVNSYATTFTDVNNANVYLNLLHTSYTGTWDIADKGYNPSSMKIDSATIEFLLWDGLGAEKYTITIAGGTYASGGSFAGTIAVGGSLENYANILADLSADGILKYTVSRNSGEFWLNKATLTAEASKVPDGGATVGLLGLGMLGCFCASRKKN